MDLAVKRSIGYGGMYAFTVFIEDKLGFNGKLNLKDFSYFSLSQIIVELYRNMAPEHYVWAMVWTLDLIGKENYDIADAFWRSLDTIVSDKIARFLMQDEPIFTLKYKRYFKEFIAYYLGNKLSAHFEGTFNSYLAVVLKKGIP